MKKSFKIKNKRGFAFIYIVLYKSARFWEVRERSREGKRGSGRMIERGFGKEWERKEKEEKDREGGREGVGDTKKETELGRGRKSEESVEEVRERNRKEKGEIEIERDR